MASHLRRMCDPEQQLSHITAVHAPVTDPGAAARPNCFYPSAATPQSELSLQFTSYQDETNNLDRNILKTIFKMQHSFEADSKGSGNWSLPTPRLHVLESESEREQCNPEKTSRLPKPKDGYTQTQAQDKVQGESKGALVSARLRRLWRQIERHFHGFTNRIVKATTTGQRIRRGSIRV